jgi:hypothetical protein
MSRENSHDRYNHFARGNQMNAAAGSPEILRDTMLSMIAERGEGKSICPSEVARAIAGDHPDNWGLLMQPVRRAAVALTKEGRMIILRKGKPADPDDFRGVYRLSMPRCD